MKKKLLLSVFSLLFFCSFAKAQGAIHVNTAQSSFTPPSNLGISGLLLQPIPGAVITVCSGSSLPVAGVTCAPTTTIYSNITLTTVLPNPTNADSNGNYFFYATGATSYVISVSGTGLTTYSYVWTAPVVAPSGSGANAALSNLSGVNINTSLFPQAGVALGSNTKPFQNLYLYGSGTYGSAYIVVTGDPSGSRNQSLQDTSDTFVYLATPDTLTNKTFSVSANTLKNVTNAVGHYLRNNGTQYVDSTLQSADLPATTSNCTGTNFAQGINAGGTPICSGGSNVSVVYSTPSSSTNTNIGATTMVTPAASASYLFSWYAELSAVGTTCASQSSITVTITYQDPIAAGTTVGTVILASGTSVALVGGGVNNGVLGPAYPWAVIGGPGPTPSYLFRAKVGVPIQYAVTYAIGGGCTIGPSYTLFPILEQLTAN